DPRSREGVRDARRDRPCDAGRVRRAQGSGEVLTMASSFDVVGKSTPKRDGPDKVTGRTRYLHDLELPRLLHGKILRTPVPHARIVRIDTSRARALPGVLAVLTGEDVEQRPFGFVKDQLALKRGKVRCIRDEVAAVAAETAEIAEEALTLIDADYAPLPAVFEPLAALEPGAPIVHEELVTNAHHLRYRFVHGDVDRAFAEAAGVARRPVKIEFDRVEEFVACPTREPCAIRLRTAADRDGRLLARDAHVTIDSGAYTSWGSTTPYVMMSTVAGLYRVPNVRFDTTIAYTNNPYSGSMRGYGNPESTFAVESQ